MDLTGTIFVGDPEVQVEEGAGTIQAKISRAGSLAGEVVITYGITTDTATAGEDFDAGSGTVTMPDGAAEVSVPIAILDDATGEGTESLVLSLINVDGPVALVAPRTSRISILDDEAPTPPPEAEPPLASDYTVTQTPVVEGLEQPIRFRFSPLDPNKAFLAEKSGVIKVVDVATGEATTFLDLRDQVNEHGDRGLLSVALHPDFANNPYVYAFVIVDPANTAGKTGYDAPDGMGNRYGQVVRFTADAATGYTIAVPGSQVVLVGDAGRSLQDISGHGAIDFTAPWASGYTASDRYVNEAAGTPTEVIGGFKQDFLKADAVGHSGGDLAFGPDGMLYVSTGDATSFNYADPRTPDVQALDGLSGKILRIDPITGQGLADNPFAAEAASLDANRAKIFQYGLRNPYSMAFDGDGRLFIGDTGWNSYEEINAGGPGANFGWPFFEGGDGGALHQPPTYRDFASAAGFYAKVEAGEIRITPAFRAFSHESGDPGFQMQAITSGDVILHGDRYPASLQGHFVFADFSEGEIYAVDVDDRTDVKFLYKADSPYAPIHFAQAPDGTVYYADLIAGQIGRLDITGPGEPGPEAPIGEGLDALVLEISQDAWQGSAQYTVSVDGVQVGGVLTASALHGSGDTDTVTLRGDWGGGTHTVQVTFLNDAWGGSAAADRNLYVEGVSYDGLAHPAGSAALLWSGWASFEVAAPAGTPVHTTLGDGGPDRLELAISGDAWEGGAQYRVFVDGAPIGGILTAHAAHGSGRSDTVTLEGDWAPGAHSVGVEFLNDAYSGPGADRNLYLDGLSYNGVPQAGGDSALYWGGLHGFAFADTGEAVAGPAPVDTTLGAGPNTLVLKLSQDAWQGRAQYTVSVDGVQVGGTLTAGALHGSGSTDTLTLHGEWSAGPHAVALNFLNDAWGGSAAADRNLHVEAITFDGAPVPVGVSALLWGGEYAYAFM